jgi:hypothetical protein
MRVALALTLLLITQNVAAQTAAPGAGRSARDSMGVQRLSAFAGSWKMADDGSGQNLTETCGWLPGGQRHMICRTTLTAGNRTSQNETVYSYRGRDSTYIVTSFVGGGPLLTYHGKFNGDRWVLDFQSQTGSNQRLRMLVRASSDEIHFVEESSENGSKWQITENYRYVRVKQGG